MASYPLQTHETRHRPPRQEPDPVTPTSTYLLPYASVAPPSLFLRPIFVARAAAHLPALHAHLLAEAARTQLVAELMKRHCPFPCPTSSSSLLSSSSSSTSSLPPSIPCPSCSAPPGSPCPFARASLQRKWRRERRLRPHLARRAQRARPAPARGRRPRPQPRPPGAPSPPLRQLLGLRGGGGRTQARGAGAGVQAEGLRGGGGSAARVAREPDLHGPAVGADPGRAAPDGAHPLLDRPVPRTRRARGRPVLVVGARRCAAGSGGAGATPAAWLTSGGTSLSRWSCKPPRPGW